MGRGKAEAKEGEGEEAKRCPKRRLEEGPECISLSSFCSLYAISSSPLATVQLTLLEHVFVLSSWRKHTQQVSSVFFLSVVSLVARDERGGGVRSR